MKFPFCVACGNNNTAELEHHHLVPRSKGGSDELTNLITLCHVCHGKAHGYQRANIGKLTRDALAAAKARGVRLGSPEGVDTSHIARAAKSAKAQARAKRVRAIIEEIERDGPLSLSEIASALTVRGIRTPRGNENWTATQVARVRHLAAARR